MPLHSYLVLTQMDHETQAPVICGVYTSLEDLKCDALGFLECVPFDPATDDVAVAPFIKHYSDIACMDLYATGELMVVRGGQPTPTGLYVWDSAKHRSGGVQA